MAGGKSAPLVHRSARENDMRENDMAAALAYTIAY